MSQRPQLLIASTLLAGGLVVGAAAGFLFGGSDGGRPDDLSRVCPRCSTQALGPATSQTLREESRDAPRPALILSSEYGTSLEAMLGNAFPLQDLVGDGRITGFVRTEQGLPLAGVVIRATPERIPDVVPGRKGDGPPDDGDLAFVLRRLAQEERDRRSGRRQSTSDESGSFVIDGVGDDPYGVEAWLRGYDLRPVAGRGRVRAGAEIEFLATPILAVRADVLLPDGTRPPLAWLEWQAGNRRESQVWSPRTPDLRLAAGVYAIEASAGDAKQYRACVESISLQEGREPPSLSFRLQARAGITGRVRTPAGMDDELLCICILKLEDGALPDPERLLGQSRKHWAQSENDYSFAALDLAPGTYAVGVGPPGAIQVVATATVLMGAVTEMEIEIPTLEGAGPVLWVLAPDGTPLADASLRVLGEGGVFSGGSVRRRRDGAFILQVLAHQAADRPASQGMLVVDSARYGRKSFELAQLTRDGASELRLVMDPPALLEVTLVNHEQDAVRGGLRLSLSALLEDGREAAALPNGFGAVAGPGARTSFSPIQPGRYRITASIGLGSVRPVTVGTLDVTAGPGENRVTFLLPSLFPLTVVGNAEHAGCDAVLAPLGRTDATPPRLRRSRRLDGAGRTVFENVPAGLYRLTLSRGGTSLGSMRVSAYGAAAIPFVSDAGPLLAGE